MRGLQELRFAKTIAPETNRGRWLDELVYREALARTGQARACSSSHQKGGANEKAADHVRVTAAFVAELLRETNPDPHLFRGDSAFCGPRGRSASFIVLAR